MRRHVGSNSFVSCSKEVKTEPHIFFGCTFFSSIWLAEPFVIESVFLVQNFTVGLNILKKNLEEASFGLACVVLWNIWNFRNECVHQEARGDRESLVRHSRDFPDSFKSARFTFPLSGAPGLISVWKPPENPFIKINFDAALYDSGKYQIAAVARDNEGVCLHWRVKKL